MHKKHFPQLPLLSELSSVSKYSLICPRLFPSPVEAILTQVSASPQTHTHRFFQPGGSKSACASLCEGWEWRKTNTSSSPFHADINPPSLWVYFTVQNVRLTAPPLLSLTRRAKVRHLFSQSTTKIISGQIDTSHFIAFKLKNIHIIM